MVVLYLLLFFFFLINNKNLKYNLIFFYNKLKNMIIINKYNYSPLEQFDVLLVKIYNLNLFLNNSDFFIFFILSFNFILIIIYIKKKILLITPLNYWSHLIEILNEQLIIITIRNLGVKIGQIYYIWIFFIFILIITFNLIGIIPYAFTVTSHIIVTFALAFALFFGINLRFILDVKLKFFNLFLPSGAPIVIIPFLVIIEIISYFARVFSLSIRLFANIIAGHTLLKILINFSFIIFLKLPTWLITLIGLFPFLLVIIIVFLEVAIAFLQAYVFTVLLCLYIKDFYVKH
jgi:ATP synthase subunit 6